MPASYKVHIGVSLFLAGLTAIAVILTLLPGSPVVPAAAAFTLFGLAFPVFGSAMLRCYRTGILTLIQGPQFPLLLWHTPRWLRAAAGSLAVGVVLCVVVGGVPASGQPERTAGGYYLNNHGDLQPVSRATYESALKSRTRWFDAGATLFFAVSALMVAAAHRAEEEALDT
ncbi:hypothetical protein [Streptomyces sp. TRM68367]|uniref:hypothetical protein n=1 Tax=Streptomyces sp. TRM68367 TaxID=2758415 RepID=UPI00293528E2|nr:hypothetical protein [Streptomyces sp. TRM68367]